MFNKNLKIVLNDIDGQPFLQPSNALAWMMIGVNWLSILALLVVCGLILDPFVWLLAIILLGGRQLGLLVLMHETGHQTLFADKRLNTVVGQWLCAAPILADQSSYSQIHRLHHRRVGKSDDPDLGYYRDYPMSRLNFFRKVINDLTGGSALALFMTSWGGKEYSPLAGAPKRGDSVFLFRACAVHILLFALLVRMGAGWGVVAWWIAFLTTYMLFARIRFMAEHGGVHKLDAFDPRLNTRTTYTGILGRLTVAPNFVNYHLDHHILPCVPAYHLPEFHRYLVRRGAFGSADIQPSYRQVIKRCVV